MSSHERVVLSRDFEIHETGDQRTFRAGQHRLPTDLAQRARAEGAVDHAATAALQPTNAVREPAAAKAKAPKAAPKAKAPAKPKARPAAKAKAAPKTKAKA